MSQEDCKIYQRLEAQIKRLRVFLDDLRAAKEEINRLTAPDEIRNLDAGLRSVQLAEQELQTKTADHAITCKVCNQK